LEEISESEMQSPVSAYDVDQAASPETQETEDTQYGFETIAEDDRNDNQSYAWSRVGVSLLGTSPRMTSLNDSTAATIMVVEQLESESPMLITPVSGRHTPGGRTSLSLGSSVRTSSSRQKSRTWSNKTPGSSSKKKLFTAGEAKSPAASWKSTPESSFSPIYPFSWSTESDETDSPADTTVFTRASEKTPSSKNNVSGVSMACTTTRQLISPKAGKTVVTPEKSRTNAETSCSYGSSDTDDSTGESDVSSRSSKLLETSRTEVERFRTRVDSIRQSLASADTPQRSESRTSRTPTARKIRLSVTSSVETPRTSDSRRPWNPVEIYSRQSVTSSVETPRTSDNRRARTPTDRDSRRSFASFDTPRTSESRTRSRTSVEMSRTPGSRGNYTPTSTSLAATSMSSVTPAALKYSRAGTPISRDVLVYHSDTVLL
jgi:hypothetical protein